MSDLCAIQDACGGCPLLGTPPELQLGDKVGRVAALLRREVDAVHPSPRNLAYRARISMRPDAQGRLGYYRPRSHDHVPVPSCAVARPEIDAVLGRLPPIPGVYAVELRSDGERVVAAVRSDRRRPTRLPDLAPAGVAGVALDGRTVAGDPTVEIAVAGIRHRLGPRTFYQVNLEVNDALVARVVDEVAARSPEAVLDLYAGAGNFSLPLAARGCPVLLVEVAGPSLDDATATAARHGLTIRTRVQSAEAWKAGDAAFDIAILDPPRAGAPGLLPELLLTRPRAIAYVSCSPGTLARDVRPVLAAGYRPTVVEVFEMFPHTSHVEVLVVFDR